MIFELSNTNEFPNPRYGQKDGFYAVGGDLSAERLIKAYPMGIFPYFAFRQKPIIWWFPHERFVIFPDEIKISHSMKPLLKRKTYTCTINEDFYGSDSYNEDDLDPEGYGIGDLSDISSIDDIY